MLRGGCLLALLVFCALTGGFPAIAQGGGPTEEQLEELARGALADRDAVAAAFANGVAAYDAGDYETAYAWWLPLARTDDPAAQRNIAQLHRLGLGVKQDFAAAAKWYRRASESGLARAQANLARMYLRGQGVEQDDDEAARWFAAAAEQGHVVAQHNLGLMHLRGRGVEHDKSKAAGWFYLAGRAGYQPSLDALEKLVDDVSASIEPGAGQTTSSADSATPRSSTTPTALQDLGRMLQAVFDSHPATVYEAPDERPPSPRTTAVMDSPPPPTDSDAARRELRAQAAAGDADAQYRLARRYLQHGDAQDGPVIAYYWMARAAAGGHATAKAELAVMKRTMEGGTLVQGELLLARWRATQG